MMRLCVGHRARCTSIEPGSGGSGCSSSHDCYGGRWKTLKEVQVHRVGGLEGGQWSRGCWGLEVVLVQVHDAKGVLRV